jgi:hypothetical protein
MGIGQKKEKKEKEKHFSSWINIVFISDCI